MGKISSRFVDGLERSYKKQWLLDLTRNADVTRVNYGHLVDVAGIDATTVTMQVSRDALLTKYCSPDPASNNFDYAGVIAHQEGTNPPRFRGLTASKNQVSGVAMPELDVNGDSMWSFGGNAERGFNVVRFYTDSIKIALRTDYSTDNDLARFRIKVNGRYLNSGNWYYANTEYFELAWATKTFRRVEIEFPFGFIQFRGAYAKEVDVVKKIIDTGRRVAFVGDSFGAGLRADYPEDAWPVYVSQYLGLSTALHNVESGTGMVNDKLTGYSFADRIGDLLIYKPDVVFISASVNDTAYSERKGDGSLIQATINYIKQLKQSLPDVNIVYLGTIGKTIPQAGLTYATPTSLDVENDMLTAVEQSGFADEIVVIPLQNDVGEPLFFGTGNVASQTGDGNADFYLASDNSHFSSQGQLYLASFVAEKLVAMAST